MFSTYRHRYNIGAVGGYPSKGLTKFRYHHHRHQTKYLEWPKIENPFQGPL